MGALSVEALARARAATERRLRSRRCVDTTETKAYSVALERFVARLHHDEAAPHHVIATHLASTFCDHAIQNAVARALDWLQLAIDIADNVVDDPGTAEGYPGDLVPTISCLPALLLGEVVLELTTLPHGRYAAERLLRVMATMASGQSQLGADKLKATAGEQGLLLCLPLWLMGSERQPEFAAVEKWARTLGRAWELWQQASEEDSQRSRERAFSATLELTHAWPRQTPFFHGEALSLMSFGRGSIFL